MARNSIYILHFLYPCFFFKFSPTVMFQSKVFENISFSMFSPTRIINFYISDSQNPRWYISIIFRGSRKKSNQNLPSKAFLPWKSGIKFEVNRFDLHLRQLIICIVSKIDEIFSSSFIFENHLWKSYTNFVVDKYLWCICMT